MAEKFLRAEPGKFSVSRAGVGVDVAKLDDLLFDARFASMREVERGTIIGMQCGRVFSVYIDSYRWDDVTPGSQTVYFSRSYPQPPTLVFGWQTTTGIQVALTSFFAVAWPSPWLGAYRGAWAVVYNWGFTIYSTQRASAQVHEWGVEWYNSNGTGVFDYGNGSGELGVLNNFKWIALA
jgi:hypothetical protein